MGKKYKQITPFTLEGRFLGFVVKDGYKIKKLRLATVDGEQDIKLSKQSRASLLGAMTSSTLIPGVWVRVTGEKTVDQEHGELKLRAYEFQVAAPGAAPLPEVAQPVAVTPPKTTVLVCQKCKKRGSEAVCQALESELSQRGLEGQVTVKTTGCMKQCKAGPNVIMMPDKTRYSHVRPSDIPAMIDKHLPPAPEPTPAPELVTVR